jgi:hypothetical protein
MKISKDLSFWFGLLIIFIMIYLSLATYFRWIDIRFRIGPYFFTHWLSWIGSLFIAFFTPAYYVLKRRIPKLLPKLIMIHMFGNLLSSIFISMHFFQQISRPPQFYPDLGTGVALFVIILILATSGFLHRFQIVKSIAPHQNRFLHISITTAFYIVVVIHILQGIGTF